MAKDFAGRKRRSFDKAIIKLNEGKTTDEKQPCALVCVLHAVFPYADDGSRDGIVRHGTECELINYDTSRNTVS